MEKINIGLIGFGTVGSGLYHLLRSNSEIIIRRTGLNINLKTICDLRGDHVRSSTTGVDITDRWGDIIDDDDIDIVAELIGGIEPAKSIITGALKKGQSVVTANKKLLAEEGREIFRLASTGEARLGFEASVGGGIPCILALRHGLAGNRIRSIMGILNGTTNYILSKMEDTEMTFPQALADAQERGFAEADPTFDIEGFDAGHKIALLSLLAFNKNIGFTSVPIEGISRINRIDISYARDMGYVIKLLGIAKEIDGILDIRVHPTMIPQEHPLASVRHEHNSIMFDGDMTGPVIMTGKGAGSYPTASAVLSDIVQIAVGRGSPEPSLIMEGDARLILPGRRVSRYYIRMSTDDRPGILASIAGVLGQNEISISSVIQKEVHGGKVPLILMTHEAEEEGMLCAVKEIREYDFVHGDVVLIRVEDSLHSGEEQ